MLALNPRGMTDAVLKDGSVVVCDSLAALLYLEEAYDSGSQLMPADPKAKALVRSLACVQASVDAACLELVPVGCQYYIRRQARGAAAAHPAAPFRIAAPEFMLPVVSELQLNKPSFLGHAGVPAVVGGPNADGCDETGLHDNDGSDADPIR